MVFAGAVAIAVSLGVARSAGAQPTVTFEQMVADLLEADPDTRLRAVLALKQVAYPESALPLTQVISDPEDAIQLEAIAAELNVFLAEKIVPRKRVALVVEVRNQISAMAVFDQGAGAIDPRPVPAEVLSALRAATHDNNPRVSVEALYAFGALVDNAYGSDRQRLLAESASELAGSLGVPQADIRAAAVRVITRLYGWRAGDPAADQAVGDALVVALNDREVGIRMAALDGIGALRYERGVQAVTDLFEHQQRGTVASAALGSLARIAHSSSLPVLVAALPVRDTSLRLAAIEGLARMREVAQAGPIRDVLASERNADLLLAGQFAGVLLTNAPVDTLVDGLTRSASLRERAIRYLVEAVPGRANLLGPYMQNSQPGVRIGLIEALGLSGDRQALAVVEPMLRDADPAVARAAARAAARLEPQVPRLP